MNFRITTLFFGLLLTTLWVFGLMIAHKKSALDQGAVMPTMQSPAIDFDKIVIQRTVNGKELPETQLVNIDGRWYLKKGDQQARIEGFRAKEIIKAVKEARHEETAEVSKDFKENGLDKPQVTVTLFGKEKKDDKLEDKQWAFHVGKESADKSLYFVNSSDWPNKAFAVSKRPLDSLFVSDPDSLRQKRLFDYTTSSVTEVQIAKEGKDLDLKREANNLWTFVKPALGFAGYENPQDDKDKKKLDMEIAPKKKNGITTVKELLEAVVQVQVEEDADFVPLGQPASQYGLETGKAPMRIEITTTTEKDKTDKDKKDKDDNKTSDTLLVGKKIKNQRGEFYYARLASDSGVMLLSAKYFDPIDKVLDDPGIIRSRDVAFFDPKNVDAIILKDEKSKIKFFKETDWQMYVGGEKKKANEKAVETLLEQTLGKNAIVAFELDHLPKAELEKKEAELGLVASAPEVAVYVGGIDKDRKEDVEEKKEKKDEGKKDEAKKDETKKELAPALKKDLAPAVKLLIGKTDKEVVHIKRTLQNGAVSYFMLKKEFVEKVFPAQGIALAYLDAALPSFAPNDVVSLDLARTSDKGKEKKIDLERRIVDNAAHWYVKDPAEPTGAKLADNKKAVNVAGVLGGLRAEQWIKKIEPKEDLSKYGLKNPAVVATVTLKKEPLTTNALASVLGMLASGSMPALFSAFPAVAYRQNDKGEIVATGKTETVKFEFGNPIEKDNDKESAVYGIRSGSDLLFQLSPKVVKDLKEVDLRDRSLMMFSQAAIEAINKTDIAVNPINSLLLASPYFSGTIQNLDPEKVREIRLSVRTPVELRTFGFERNDKTWQESDNTKLRDFYLDGAKVSQLVKELCKLKTKRFVAFTEGPRGEHNLGPKEFSAKIELLMSDGPPVELTIGSSYPGFGHFATSSLWKRPDGKLAAVFFVSDPIIESMLREGLGYFSKEVASGD